jgi:hypothetical protein
MKIKISRSLVLLSLLLAAMVMINCGGSDGDNNGNGNGGINIGGGGNNGGSSIVGTWRTLDQEVSYTFNANGQWSATQGPCQLSGPYTLNKDGNNQKATLTVNAKSSACDPDVHVGDVQPEYYYATASRIYFSEYNEDAGSPKKDYPFIRNSGSSGLVGAWKMPIKEGTLPSQWPYYLFTFSSNGNFTAQVKDSSGAVFAQSTGTFQSTAIGEMRLNITSCQGWEGYLDVGSHEGFFWLDSTGSNMAIATEYFARVQ